MTNGSVTINRRDIETTGGTYKTVYYLAVAGGFLDKKGQITEDIKKANVYGTVGMAESAAERAGYEIIKRA